MKIFRDIPGLPLRNYVDFFWYYVDWAGEHTREHVLPDGTFELIINLQETPRKLFNNPSPNKYESFRKGWISGAQSRFLIVDAVGGSSMIGVHFKPGGAAEFLGCPADELRDRIVELDTLWGNGVWHWREQILAAQTAKEKFLVLEKLLLEKLHLNQKARTEHHCVSWAVDRYVSEPNVRTFAAVSSQVGFSQKHFIRLFEKQTGLTPKLFCRLRRFHQVLSEIQSRRTIDWPDVAQNCGYFDQAHFIRDFSAFSGLTPSLYLNRRLEYAPSFTKGA